MPTLQLDADGSVIDFNDADAQVNYVQGEGVTVTPGTVGDPTAPADYTDQELNDALPFTQALGSPEQASLDASRARINFCQAKADRVTGYDADGKPQYEVGDAERRSLLNTVKNLTNGLELQLVMANRNIARRHLDSNKKAADAQAQLAHYAALEARAVAITFEQDATDLAKIFRKRSIGQ